MATLAHWETEYRAQPQRRGCRCQPNQKWEWHVKNDNVLRQVRGWVKTLQPPARWGRPSLSPETHLYTDVFNDLFLDSDDILC
jgi:hypothetical protein